MRKHLKWVKRINSHSGQTLRQTKKSLNAESDELYASWQHGMELLAHVWGSEESLEGMHAFLEKRKPDFKKFRDRNAAEVKQYLSGLENDDNIEKIILPIITSLPFLGYYSRAYAINNVTSFNN